jgi:hypothetical protein
LTELSEHKIEITIALFLLGGILTWIFIPISVQEDTIIFLTESGGTPTPCSGNLGLILAQNLTDLCDVVIVTPINTQVLQYNGTYWVNANVTVTDDTVCANVGGGIEVFKNGECNFRTLVGSSDINIIQNTDTIVIDYNGTAGGDTTVCTNVGVGTGLICRGGNVDIKSLIQGSGITITNNADDITITNASPDNTSCVNVGSGLGVYASGECIFNSLIAGTGITITDTTDDLTFASQCANTGTGEAICESSNNINSLIAGSGIDITDTTGDLTISSETVFYVKPSDETVTNSAVLQDDDDLRFQGVANAIYKIQLCVRLNEDSTSDFKYAFTAPAGAIVRGHNTATALSWPNGAASDVDNDLTASRIITFTSSFVFNWCATNGWVIMGGNSGEVVFQWAQNTAQSNNTILEKGSHLIVTRLV